MRRSGSWSASPPPLSPAPHYNTAAATAAATHYAAAAAAAAPAGHTARPASSHHSLLIRSPSRVHAMATAAGGVVTRVKREGSTSGARSPAPFSVAAGAMPLIGSSNGSSAAAAAPSTPTRHVQVKRQPSSGSSSASWALSPRRASLEDSEACAWNIAGEESQNAAVAAAAAARLNGAAAAQRVSSPARTQLRSAAQKCPVRGCNAAYVKAASLHKHMKLLHRGARATRELASSIPADPRAPAAAAATGASPTKNARKRKLVVDPAAAVFAAVIRADSNVSSTASTPTSTPRKSPRARRAAAPSPPLPTAAAAAAASSSSAAAAQPVSSDDDDDDEDSDASDSDSSSGSEGAPRQVALPVRLPPFNAAQQMQIPNSAAAAALSASSRPAAAAAAIPARASGPRIFPPYPLASAFPAHARDGSHPVLALLSKLLAQHASLQALHRGSRLSVDDLLAHYLLSRFDLRSNPAASDRKSFQALLTHALWIRGGLERWARNWKKYSVPQAAATPRAPKRRGSKTESTSAAAADDDADSDDSEASWWRRFNLGGSYSLIPLLGRMRSFLDVTFKHGEGKSLPPGEQHAIAEVIKGAKKWALGLPPAPASVASLPPPMEMVPQAAAAAAAAVQQHRQQQQQQRKQTAAAAASSTPAAPTRSTSTSRAAAAAAAADSSSSDPLVPAPPVWTASSLSQLNSLLVSNNGLVNRNLTLRQIAETLGEGHTPDSVRVRVDQIRKAKSMEESRAAFRVEQERKQAAQERIVEAARTKSKRSKKNAAADDEEGLNFGSHPLSSVIPSMGNRGRKRKGSAVNEEQQAAMMAAAQSAAPLASRARATQRAGAKTYSPVRNHPAAPAAAAPLPAAAAAASSSAAAAAPAAVAVDPPAKRQRQSKKQKQALADAAAAAAASAASAAAGSPPPPPQYGMMPYPMHPGGMMPQHGMMPYPYPMHPYAAPPPPSPAPAATGGRAGAAAAAAPPPLPSYPYPSPYGMPWGAHGHAGMPPHPGSYPPPPPPPPGAAGQQMQWSWMLVPMPVPQQAPPANAAPPAGRR